MLESQKSFIQRHVREFLKQNLNPSEALEKALMILNDFNLTKKAMKKYEESKSLTNTLHYLGVIQLEAPLLNAIEKQESLSPSKSTSIIALIEANETITQSFNLLKIRLSVGLVYALWLSFLATLVFSIMQIKVMPHFQELFEGFVAELPRFTQMSIDWQNSLFSPSVIGMIFNLIIIGLLISVHSLSKKNTNNILYTKLPFINKAVLFANGIHWLSQLRVLNSSGLDIKDCLDILGKQPANTKKHFPEMLPQLKTAEKINNTEAEFVFQTHQITQLAEKIVTGVSRNLVALIMLFVAGYVVFGVFSVYLPIFQLGAVI